MTACGGFTAERGPAGTTRPGAGRGRLISAIRTAMFTSPARRKSTPPGAGPGLPSDSHPKRQPRWGTSTYRPRAQNCRICVGSAMWAEPTPSRTKSAGRKLFEPKTMCPLVTLHDRAEPVVVHFDCDQFPAGRAVMGSRKKCAPQAVPCRTVENSVFTFRSPPPGARVHWPAQVHGEFLSRNLSATWSQ